MILVIDSGTTNTKALLFTRECKVVSESRVLTKTSHPGHGMVEQEATEWWNAAVTAVSQCLSSCGTIPEIDAIVTSTQGGTFAVLDRNLYPLRPGITWLDNRAASEAEEITRTNGEEIFFKTGHTLRGWCPPAVIRWMEKNEPDTYRKIARISFVADYLNYRMTGKFFIDQTGAGMTVFYNILSGLWDNDILKISGITIESLPRIVCSGEIGGTLTAQAAKILGLKEGIPVISGGHDQYCASYGAGAIKIGDCLLSCGTAWALLILTEKPVFEANSGWNPGRHFWPGTFGLMGAISNGGIVLDWFRKNLLLSDAPRNLEDTDKNVRVTPFFSEGKGAIENLTLSTGAGHIYRAAVKSIVEQVILLLEQVKSKATVERLFLVGGGAKEPLLKPVLSESAGYKIIQPETQEAAARGAALLVLKYLDIQKEESKKQSQ